MSKPRILLISSQQLFGESIEMVLRAEKDVELIGPWDLNDHDTGNRLQEAQPSVVVIADEDLQSESATRLTTSILERYPELSVIRTGLNENIFRIFSTHTVPARGADLLETVRSCVTRLQDADLSDDMHK
jgi:DNA-binding NarL/FixJ family response regulator